MTHQPSKPKFAPGDRVAERPKATAIPGLKAATLERIKAYKAQRFGVVVDTFVKSIKTQKRGTVNRQFVRVLWDGLKTPSDHEQMRLVHEEEFPRLQNEYMQAIGG